MATTPKLWRQGDVFVMAVDELPSGHREPHGIVLAKGEITGHAHRLEGGQTTAFRIQGQLYVEVTGEAATLMHDEHRPITIPRGTYEIRIQREYAPAEIRRVVD